MTRAIPTCSDRTAGQRLLLLIGALGPIGRAPASGTLAVAVVGVPLVVLMRRHLGLSVYVPVTLAFGMLAVWIHHRGDRLLGQKDSRLLVLDELVGYLIAMATVPITWPTVLLGFLLERLIDIVKVPPADAIERRLPGGWGVVFDDVVAGLYTWWLLHLATRCLPRYMGLT